MDNYRRLGYWLGVGLLLAWFFGAMGLFYVVQKPFSPAAAMALAGPALDLLAAGWLALLGLGLGQRLLRWVGLAEASTGERLILGAGLGLGGLGLATLALGLAGLFYRWLFLGLSLLLSLVVWPDLAGLRRRLRRWQPPRPGRLAAIYVGAVGLFALLAGLLPPVDWDGLFYHLTAPHLYVAAHRIYPGLDVPHFNFPFLAEMLFADGMLLRGDIAAKLIHTLYGFLLAGLVYLTGRRCLGRQTGWPAVLVLLSMPMVLTLAGWAYNDLALAFYQLAAVYALLRSRPQAGHQDPEEANGAEPAGGLAGRWLVLAGLMAGLAMGLKYTSFVGPLAIGLVLLWWTLRRSSPLRGAGRSSPLWRVGGAALRPLLAFAVPALLAALPWYLKNLLFTGNPVYPFLFGGLFWDPFRAAWYAQAGSGVGFDPLTLAGLPVLAMLGVRDVNYFDGRTGPLFLVFLPLLLLYGLLRYRARRPERPAALDLLLFFGLAHFLFWAVGVVWSNSLWQSRLLLPALAILSPVVGWLWQDLAHLDRPGFSVRRFANLLVGLALALNLVEMSLGMVGLNPLAYLAGYESRAGYLTRRLGAHYAAMDRINQTLPAGAGVVLLWEPRSYYCRLECRPDSILDEFAHMVYRYGTAGAIARAWQAAGIGYVSIHRAGLDFIQNESPELVDRTVLAELERCYLEELFDVAGTYQVYRLKAGGCAP